MFSEPIYIPSALNTGTCLRQGVLLYSAGLHRNHVLATANTGKIGGGFGPKNAGEWTGRVEISKEEIPGSKRSMYDYRLTYSRLGVRQVPEGSGEQGKMEKTGCKIIRGAPTTLAVKGLMMIMMIMTPGFKGRTFKLVFSLDGTLIFASTAPYCGGQA